MPVDDSDDLYDGDYEFVDDHDDDHGETPAEEAAPVEEKPKKRVKRKTATTSKTPVKKKTRPRKKAAPKKAKPAEVVEEEEPLDEPAPAAETPAVEAPAVEPTASVEAETEAAAVEKPAEEKPPEPVLDYVVHVYELKEFKRTIAYPFTLEDADAFATEYNRTSKPHSRWAVTGKKDEEPGKVLAP